MRLSVRIPAIVTTAAGVALLAYKARSLYSTLSSPTTLQSLMTAGKNTAATAATAAVHRAPVIALSHGGGPLPVLGDPDSAHLVQSLRTRVPAILGLDDPARRPRAIVLVTAHWSESQPNVASGAQHKLLYDYGGFPAEAYRLKYEAPGEPAVAARVAEVMQAEGLTPKLDPTRPWDHGVFIPMLLVRPEADIPIVQVSVLRSEDPAAHFAMGRALGRLRDENIAIVGSGFASFHNLRAMFSGIARQPDTRAQLEQWNAAVRKATTTSDARDREEQFRHWRLWPATYLAHPQNGAEHMMPLLVCAGAAGDDAVAQWYVDEYLGFDIYSFYWE